MIKRSQVGLLLSVHGWRVEARMRKATMANHFFSPLSIKNLLLLSILLKASSGIVWQSYDPRPRGQSAVSNIFLPRFSQNSARSPKIMLPPKYCSNVRHRCDFSTCEPELKMTILLLDANFLVEFWLDSSYHSHS